MNEYVPDEVRDRVMEYIVTFPENHNCFDCGNKNPNWASAYLGILICFECAARHRSYGTHISFIRSINLDRWNKKQLKSMEISGNRKVRERLNELGVSKISGIFDYSSDSIQKLKNELGESVIGLLKAEIIPTSNGVNSSSGNTTATNNQGSAGNTTSAKTVKANEDTQNTNKIKKIEDINFDDVTENIPKSEVKEAMKFKNFEDNLNVKISTTTNESKGRKINKIQKVDFDFDFDNFKETNFSSLNTNNDEEKNKKVENQQSERDKELKEKDFSKNEEEDEDRYYNKPKLNQEEIKKKFANKKAISSEDYEQLEENPSEKTYYKTKINSMKNHQAISSSDVYGETDDYQSNNLGDKLKDMALNFTVKAAEKAKDFKDKASNFITRVQNKYGN